MLRQLLKRFAAWLVTIAYNNKYIINEDIDVDLDGADYVHIMPINDLVEHEWDNDGDCPCGLDVQPVEREDGTIAWVYMHNALDGRDLEEQGQGVPMENPHGLLDDFDGME